MSVLYLGRIGFLLGNHTWLFMRIVPNKEMIKQSWEKYGLIVIGNVVFFVLLYFISYRPNNDENRAAEFLSMAQAQETQKRNEAALVLYQKVLRDYPDTRSSLTAKKRLVVVRKRLLSLPNSKKEPEIVQPRIDLERMLNRRPSVYIATFLADHYNDEPALQPKIKESISHYLGIAANHEGVGFEKLRKMKVFQTDFFKSEIFSIKPKCVFDSDWIYDNFRVINTNFFPWHQVSLKLVVGQGQKKVEKDIRVDTVAPNEEVDVLEFRVKSSLGAIHCNGQVTAQEGTAVWSNTL